MMNHVSCHPRVRSYTPQRALWPDITPTSHTARSRAIRCAGSSTARRPLGGHLRAMAWRKGQECD
eukprot:5062344-Prymnesium_polylepis.1